jgi:ubiquinone/menaquinone biosynthesis C-methylase UbiE
MNEFTENTRQAFDKIAGSYDRDSNQNPILMWMRGIVQKVYLNEIYAGSNVLELNSGTGIDAVFLAENGINILATDISPGMMNIVRGKAKHLPSAGGKIICEEKSFERINEITENNFDAVISNFGGLNCINDFEKLSGDLYGRLKQGGKFIAVVMNKFCPWEIFYYSLKLDFKNAFRRFNKEGIMADLNGEKVKTYYFSPGEFSGYFKKHFNTVKIYTLGYYTPPPYLAGIYNRLKAPVKLFMKIDELIAGMFPFSRFGDHFIIVMSRK